MSSCCCAHLSHFCSTECIWISICCAWSIKIKKIKSFFLVKTLTHLLLLVTIFIILGFFGDFCFLPCLLSQKIGYFVAFIMLLHQLRNEKIFLKFFNDIFPLFNFCLEIFVIFKAHSNRLCKAKFSLQLPFDGLKEPVHKRNDPCLFVEIRCVVNILKTLEKCHDDNLNVHQAFVSLLDLLDWLLYNSHIFVIPSGFLRSFHYS